MLNLSSQSLSLMCEQFKTNFINKICQHLEGDVVNSLERHYDVIVRPCIFKNESKDCKQIYVINLYAEDYEGIQCVTCKGFICYECKRKKTFCNMECINCYMKDHEGDIKVLSCKYCKSSLLYEINKAPVWDRDLVFYCKSCNTLL
jgi:hypothetical protein